MAIIADFVGFVCRDNKVEHHMMIWAYTHWKAVWPALSTCILDGHGMEMQTEMEMLQLWIVIPLAARRPSSSDLTE